MINNGSMNISIMGMAIKINGNSQSVSPIKLAVSTPTKSNVELKIIIPMINIIAMPTNPKTKVPSMILKPESPEVV